MAGIMDMLGGGDDKDAPLEKRTEKNELGQGAKDGTAGKTFSKEPEKLATRRHQRGGR